MLDVQNPEVESKQKNLAPRGQSQKSLRTTLRCVRAALLASELELTIVVWGFVGQPEERKSPITAGTKMMVQLKAEQPCALAC